MFTIKYLNKTETFDHKVSLLDLLKGNDPEKRYIAAEVNNRVRELEYEIYYDAEVEFLDLSNSDACKIYEATLRYIVSMAFHRCYPDLKIRFLYNVSRSISISILNPNIKATTAMLLKVKKEIDAIIAADYELRRLIVPNGVAETIYKEWGYEDKIEMLQYRPEKTVHIYECEGYQDYMYSRLLPSTGYIKDYKLRLFTPNFLLQYPRAEEGGIIPEFQDAPTYGRVLAESHDWAKLVGTNTAAGINNLVKTMNPVDFINLCESYHSRELCELGEMIKDGIGNIKIICIAGPSSSGKTTFANRLRIELLSRGIKSIRISLDDYYKEKCDIPLGPDGQPDLETIEGLDIELFNRDMVDLIGGSEVQLPRFDFQIGHRVPGRKLQLGENELLIIEGIHALNDRMTSDVPKSAKFKIFISPQSQINLDDHNPFSLTDVRLIRRIVRDSKFRNSPAEETLSMWSSVRRGEFTWIYDTQEGADYVFNSQLSYELPVMKKYAYPLLSRIDKESEYWPAAQRLVRMLKYFVEMDDKWVPNNSLLREFIGGSCYQE